MPLGDVLTPKAMRRTPLSKKGKKKTKTITQLKKDADRVFSIAVRSKNVSFQGYVKCFTCDVQKPLSEMQCGHYWSRQYLWTRYDHDNCRPQCASCNIFKHGNYPVFSKRLRLEIGDERFDALEEKAHCGEVFGRSDYEAVIAGATDVK